MRLLTSIFSSKTLYWRGFFFTSLSFLGLGIQERDRHIEYAKKKKKEKEKKKDDKTIKLEVPLLK